MLNIGVLYRSIEILEMLNEYNISEERFANNFPVYKYVQTKYILDVCKTCGWINKSVENFLKPTSRGHELRASGNTVDTLRLQLKDILNAKPPAWLKILKYGRKKAKLYMSKDEVQCFQSAGLMDSQERSAIAWWDEFFVQSFDGEEKAHFKTGRKGENLTLLFEELRTKSKPKLWSIDVNFAGFDVLSQVSEYDQTPLLIEVKCSELSWDAARFFISRNEWDVFCNNKNSIVYIWSINPTLRFSRLTYADLHGSVPKDQGVGKWSDVQMPFSLSKPTVDPFSMVGLNSETKELISGILSDNS